MTEPITKWDRMRGLGFWLHGLASAAIVGGGTAAFDAFIAPPVNWKVIGAAAVFGGARAMFMHLKEKPLPPIE